MIEKHYYIHLPLTSEQRTASSRSAICDANPISNSSRPAFGSISCLIEKLENFRL